MQRPVAIGVQSFAKLRENSCFYVDKTHFIKDWWEGHDDITLVTRPSRFGKTLDNLKPSVSDTTTIIECDVLNSKPDVEYLKKWVESFK